MPPQRLWWLLAVVALAAGYVGAQFWRRRAAVRFTQVDLLDKVAPSRPGWRRHVVAGVQLLGLAAGVVAIARPITTTTERTEAEGRILLMFDVSLSMQATDVQPSRLDAAKEAARKFVDQVAPDVEVGLISFSGNVNIEVDPTLDRGRLDDGIGDLELAESTAIGDALSVGTRLLVQEAGDAASNGKAPGAIVLLSDGETTVGQPTEDGAEQAADAKIPVFTIAFGTESGSITDPQSGETVPVPVKPEPLAGDGRHDRRHGLHGRHRRRAQRRLREDPVGDRRHPRRRGAADQRADVAVGGHRPPADRHLDGRRHVVAPRHDLVRGRSRRRPDLRTVQ